MVFSSIPFIFFFFPIFLAIYGLMKNKFKNIILLIFSLIFYAWGEPIYIILMIFSSIVDYTNGRLIEKYRDNINKKKIFLIFSIIINIGLLGFFKYSDFLIENINNIFGSNIDLLKLGLPIGISFFTFQTMSYSIDVYRGKVKAEKNFINFMTYVSMFPQLIAGPIVRYEEISKALDTDRKVSKHSFFSGFIRFLQGLFKKVLIANIVGELWNVISLDISNISIVTAWLGIIAFAIQIYFDFSGYSDMAIGIGKMIGFNYPENFNYPYISKSITEFWRRWHMSLSGWFKDYVYIPLGGNRCSKIINIRNILIVWFLTGLWHGAEWNFAIWGIYFGVILIVEKFILKNKLEKAPKIIRHIYALFLILIGWMIFAFDDVNNLVEYASKMFWNNNILDIQALEYLKNYLTVIISGVILSIPIYPLILEKIKKMNEFKAINIAICITFETIMILIYLILFIITISMLVAGTYNPFLYFRF